METYKKPLITADRNAKAQILTISTIKIFLPLPSLQETEPKDLNARKTFAE